MNGSLDGRDAEGCQSQDGMERKWRGGGINAWNPRGGRLAKRRELRNRMFALLPGWKSPPWKFALPSEVGIYPQTPFQTARWRCLPGALPPLVRTTALEGRGITSSFALACWPPLDKPLQVGQVIVTNGLLPEFMDLAVERSPTGGKVQPTGGWNVLPLGYSGC